MRIRIKNIEKLIYFVLARKNYNDFLIGNTLYEKLKRRAASYNEEKMNFVIVCGEISDETVIRFEKCDQFYRIDCVTVNGSLLYRYSKFRGGVRELIIDAE